MAYTPDFPPSGFQSSQPACIWVSAGVLSYQLCEREFACEQCPLDAAMRMHQNRTRAAGTTTRWNRPPALAADCSYTRSHCWVRSFGDKVRVGIESGLAGILPQPTAVVSPVPNVRLHRSQPCVWLVHGDEMLRLRAPVDGVVSAIHENMSERWHLVKDDPYAAGWLYEISTTAAQVESSDLMNADLAAREYEEDARKFNALIAEAGQSGGALKHVMMQDGGELSAHAAEIVGRKKYFTVIHDVFGI